MSPASGHGLWSGVRSRATQFMARPGIRHLVVALGRFNERLGSQFAGSLTYLSFLALIPILMVAFSVAGFVLASRPAVLTDLQTQIAEQLPKGLSTTVSGILDTAVHARLTIGILGLVIALYSGVSWMGNLRAAIQAMWRPNFDTDNEVYDENLLKYYGKSLMYLLLLGAAVLVSIGLTVSASSAQSVVLTWLGADRVSWLGPVLRVVPILLAAAADVLIFGFLYQTLSPRNLKPARAPLIRGAVAASVAFEILKYAFTALLPLVLTSTTAQLFGQVIGLLIFFNLVATVVLFIAAWIATAPGAKSAPPAHPTPTKPARHDRNERTEYPGAPVVADAGASRADD